MKTQRKMQHLNDAPMLSLTDIARYKSDEPKDVIKNWMRSKDTIEFLGLWEKLHNSNFNGVEFDSFRNQAGSNAFTMSPTKWIETTAEKKQFMQEFIERIDIFPERREDGNWISNIKFQFPVPILRDGKEVVRVDGISLDKEQSDDFHLQRGNLALQTGLSLHFTNW